MLQRCPLIYGLHYKKVLDFTSFFQEPVRDTRLLVQNYAPISPFRGVTIG